MTKATRRKDWHPADIKAALAKRGYSFARIAREHNYVLNSPNTVLWRPWAVMEKIVAGIIGVRPQVIWRSRYNRQGVHLGTKKR
jgi:Ner family transcriptional regulator